MLLRLLRNQLFRSMFVTCYLLHAQASAKRIVKYWNERRKLFGKIKAYEPMTIAGAMSEDVDTLQQGLANILPNDIHGRSVWFLDRIGNVGGRGGSSSSIENNSPTNKHEGGGGVQRKSLVRLVEYILVWFNWGHRL